MLTVPSIRGLKQLEVAASTSEGPAAAAWSPARGVVFSLGLLVAVVAAMFSAYQGYWFYITTRQDDPVAVQLQVEAEHIDHLSPLEVIQVFRQEEQEGLGEQSRPIWMQADAKHESSRQWGIAGMIVAGAGLLAAAASMIGRTKRVA